MPNDLTGGGTKGLAGTLGMVRFRAQGWGTIVGGLTDDRRSRFWSPYSHVGDICGVGGLAMLVDRETGEV